MKTKKKTYLTSAGIAAAASAVFIIAMIVFTIYPIIYTIMGSFKTNAELTSGGGFLPEAWQYKNYYQAFVEADFVKECLRNWMKQQSLMAVPSMACFCGSFFLVLLGALRGLRGRSQRPLLSTKQSFPSNNYFVRQPIRLKINLLDKRNTVLKRFCQ